MDLTCEERLSDSPFVQRVWRSTSEEAGTFTMPTCVINGDKSPISLQNTAKALMTVLPNAEYHVLAGQTHNVSMDVLAPVLIEFLTTESIDNEYHFDQQLETA